VEPRQELNNEVDPESARVRAERVGLAAALDTLTGAEADALAFSLLDRLSRDVIVQESVLRDVWRDDHDAFSAGDGEARLRDDPEDPSRRLIPVMLGAVAEYERAMIALRMARGRRRAIARGRSISPAPSFGWRKDPDDHGHLLPDPDTFPLVRHAITQLDDGATLNTVAEYLETRTERRWHATQVARLRDRYKRYSAGAE
jgi:DNA invertase Pin-like site-specific DNA recombinase